MAWKIDPTHSRVEFSVRHMMISNVRGHFDRFDGMVDFDPNDLTTLRVEVSIDPASIDTREPQRDAHLRSNDFLGAEEHQKITFRSTGVEKAGDQNLRVRGDLTIRGITHPVVLDTEYAGIMTSPWGTTSAGFSAHTKINRKDWGVEWNQALETGGVLVGEAVKINIELELIKENETVAADTENAAS